MRRELGMFVALVLMCLGLWVSNPDFLGQSNVDQHHAADLDARHLRDRHRRSSSSPAASISRSGRVIGLTGVLIAKLSSTPARAAWVTRSGSAFRWRSAWRC